MSDPRTTAIEFAHANRSRLGGVRQHEILRYAAAGIPQVELQIGVGRIGVVDRKPAERDDQVVNVGRDTVDQGDDPRDVADQADIELLRRRDRLGDVQQRDGLACQVRDHRDGRGDDVEGPPDKHLKRTVEGVVEDRASQGEQGTANRTVEVEAVKYPFQTVNTALYCEDDEFAFHGTAFMVSGMDFDPATGDSVIGNPCVPGILTTMNPADIVDDLKTNQLNNVEGTGAEPSVLSSPIDLDLEAMAAAAGSFFHAYGPR